MDRGTGKPMDLEGSGLIKGDSFMNPLYDGITGRWGRVGRSWSHMLGPCSLLTF